MVASNANSAPVANAGVNQNVPSGAVVYLDASASTDSNNDALTYRWSMLTKPTNSTATLLFPNSANPKFTADLAGTYVFGLTVNDGKVDSVLTATTVTAYGANVKPVANAGAAQNVGMGTVVNLEKMAEMGVMDRGVGKEIKVRVSSLYTVWNFARSFV